MKTLIIWIIWILMVSSISECITRNTVERIEKQNQELSIKLDSLLKINKVEISTK